MHRPSLALLFCALLPLGATANEPDEGNGEKWKVSEPPGPSHQVTIDVDEGTWMNLDVSPDGETIVFDLLGDIFAMPIEGGEARALTDGMAWDMQPRFSPDGETIAFTSDRAGGDNIWLMEADGSNPRQVTDESFRLLNNPAWTPDGEFIAARKHYTGTRSLGAGEIWLYHRSGGKGMQMTERPNDQKDVNEPAFSPDGKYLYFSQDTTPGPVFEYNKDPHGQIYEIRRLNRETGRLVDYISGAGGAVRPAPSPDGRYLAFVRRDDNQTKLFLKNRETGKVFPIFDDLERDMQEIWAIHGVYTNIAWTPDSESIVFWAGGKIRRVDVADRAVAEIPFHVEKQEKVLEALRYPVEVHPETFETRMLRWVTVSPDGNRVVFEALGKLWTRDLPDGRPERLTGQEEHFELYPAFSRDGEDIVYVTWDDRELGSVRIVDADGGTGERITTDPGHYIEPALSPDGDTVVYRRVSGGYLRSGLRDDETGVYASAVDGDAERLVSREGSRPHFGRESDRVYLLNARSHDDRELFSIELDGSDRRSHFTAKYATDIRVSPDTQWVAFRERFQAYVAPFARTGKPVALSPDTSALPVKRVSGDAGEYLHWSGDGRTVHWSLGPDLFSRSVDETFGFLSEDKESKDAETGEAVRTPIGFKAESDKPEGTIALQGGRLITIAGGAVIENGTIVIRDNRITEVGPADRVDVPADAEVIDISGKTVIPGMVDAHWHGSQGRDDIIPQQNWVNYATLAFGVTTIHDPSNDTSEIFSAAELARSGRITAPRIFSTGTILYGAETPFTAEVDSLEEARSHLKRMKAVGAFSVKSYNQPRRDQRQQIVQAARELEMMVVPEGGALFQHNMNMLLDGHTGIEHSLSVANVYDDVTQLWSGTDVGYTPTLVVAYGGIWGERYWYQHTDVYDHELLTRYVPDFVLDPQARRRTMAPEADYNHFDTARHVNKLAENGVNVQLGAHGQREGLGAHWELWMFVQGGMSPMEALEAATIGGARYLGMENDIGTLEAGKLADLVILKENPLDDIRNSEKIDRVMVNGRLYDADTMNQVAPEPTKRERFFWEDPTDDF